MIRASTSARKVSSPMTSNPSWVYALVKTSHSSSAEVESTRPPPATVRSRPETAGTGSRGGPSLVQSATSLIRDPTRSNGPRPNTCCPDRSRSSATATSNSNSASVCADPTWSTSTTSHP